jgi:hypothetical protein
MIHFFQRYSSLENTVTNNTLQLVARIYDYSAAAASKFLTDLTGESVEIGLEIAQQKSAKDSVPDGAIIQRSFKILIEAKVDALTDPDQLLRHAGAFGAESRKLLLLLTKQPIGSVEREISSLIGERYPDVVFKNVTYEAICEAAQGLFKEHEASMRALVDDYVEYCNVASLFDQTISRVQCDERILLAARGDIHRHVPHRVGRVCPVEERRVSHEIALFEPRSGIPYGLRPWVWQSSIDHDSERANCDEAASWLWAGGRRADRQAACAPPRLQ